MSQDLSKHYVNKSIRVQEKLDKLRKATLGQWQILFFFYINHILTDNETFDNKEVAFVERMRIQVMQNLVLKIRNLHVSYEMKSPTKLGHPFSFGITLHYLELTV
jgi:hypothetical protein